MARRDGITAAVAALALALGVAAPAGYADPPDHAPAYGWRAKHDHEHEHEHDRAYVGYAGNRWQRDYGIREGRCDHAAAGTVAGAIVGGAIGSTTARGDDRLVAILVGSALGAIVGHEIGRSMDAGDRACMGHALELGHEGQWVRWRDPRAGAVFALQPGRNFERNGKPCRYFTLETDRDGQRHRESGRACRVDGGEWRVIGG